MASGWRLLKMIAAICATVLIAAIFVVPEVSTGQDSGTGRGPAVQHIEPVISPKLAPLPLPVPTLPSHSPAGPVHPGGGLQNLVRTAGIIFSGKVIAVGRDRPLPALALGPNPASTSITFQVERAVRGVSPGQTLTIHEWAGLWNHGERYNLGERALLFLYAPSKLGFTSPVSGGVGKFAIDAHGSIVINRLQAVSLAGDPVLAGKTVVSYPEFLLALRRFGWEGPRR